MNKIVKLFVFVIISFVSITSCTPSYVGLQLQGSEVFSIEQSTSIYDSSREIIFDYDLYVDHKENTININGTIMIKDDVFNGAWDVDRIDLYFYFLGYDNRVLKRGHAFVRVNGEFADAKFKFSRTFDYSTDYKYVANGYEAQVSM